MAKRTTSDRENAPEPLPEEIASMGYEEAIAALEALIDQIEQGEIGLEASIAEYRRGVQLLRRCEAVLSAAESQVRELTLADVEAAGDDAGTERER
ncbi:MAG: exodeoxyribonuclease VII small subunit [Phycisphaerales bacterium]